MKARIACLLCASLLAATALAEARTVRDLHYGEVLYYFYQQKYFTAITHLGGAEHFQRFAHHGEDAELLRGGMYLSYGMHEDAARLFERVIARGAPPPVRDRAWFYLAKIRYQRGYYPEAEQALARVEGRLPGELAEEHQVLAGLLHMARAEYVQAAARLQRVPAGSDWALYARYNLGVALIRSGARDAGVRLLDEIGRLPAAGDERRALKDKANVAVGYSFLQDELPLKAREYLERVRLHGYLANKALLGMGWAHSAVGDDRRALVPWLELHQRDAFDPAVQEALLAVPYAYGRVGAHAQSLNYYQHALAAYDRESARLAESIAAIRAGKLTENVLRNDPGDDMGWFARLQSPANTAESRYLIHLLATHEFQEAFKNYRDLRFLALNLEQNYANIGAYDDMLANRRRAYGERLPRVLKDGRGADVPALQARRDAYARELARIEETADTMALATEKERAQQARLDRIGAALARNSNDEQAREKHRLLHGLLMWDVSSEYRPRLWEAKKALRATDAGLAEAMARRDALVRAQRDVPQTFDGYGRRIRDTRARIEGLQAQLRRVAAEQERYLETLAANELERQRTRLVAYVTQARFAVAQIYDQAAARTEEP